MSPTEPLGDASGPAGGKSWLFGVNTQYPYPSSKARELLLEGNTDGEKATRDQARLPERMVFRSTLRLCQWQNGQLLSLSHSGLDWS